MKRSLVWKGVVVGCASFWLVVGAGCASALHNAQAVAPQYAQAVKVKTYKGYGVEVKVKSADWVEVDGHPAAIIEKAEKATVYQSGLFNITVYKNGRVALLKEGVFVGWLKKVN